jgi:hypothetical protein
LLHLSAAIHDEIDPFVCLIIQTASVTLPEQVAEASDRSQRFAQFVGCYEGQFLYLCIAPLQASCALTQLLLRLSQLIFVGPLDGRKVNKRQHHAFNLTRLGTVWRDSHQQGSSITIADLAFYPTTGIQNSLSQLPEAFSTQVE